MITVTRTPYVEYSMCKDVHIQLARSRSQYLGAFRLVHDSYCRAGLTEPNQLGLRVTPHQLLDSSQVFVATLNDEVICTLTLVRDSELGLPIEEIYPCQIEDRRFHGVRVAEVTCLADRRLSPKRFFQLFSELSRVMAQFARREGVDEIWIACHPRHAKLYERRLAFVQQGQPSEYPLVLGNPAVPLRVDLSTLKYSHPQVWQRYFKEMIVDEVLMAEPLAQHDLAYFSEVAANGVRTGSYVSERVTQVA